VLKQIAEHRFLLRKYRFPYFIIIYGECPMECSELIDQACLKILKRELISAIGCTKPMKRSSI